MGHLKRTGTFFNFVHGLMLLGMGLYYAWFYFYFPLSGTYLIGAFAIVIGFLGAYVAIMFQHSPKIFKVFWSFFLGVYVAGMVFLSPVVVNYMAIRYIAPRIERYTAVLPYLDLDATFTVEINTLSENCPFSQENCAAIRRVMHQNSIETIRGFKGEILFPGEIVYASDGFPHFFGITTSRGKGWYYDPPK